MENHYSKVDKTIDEGVRIMKQQALDTSRMAEVLKPRSKRSMAFPLGFAASAACVTAALVLLSSSKVDASEFERVKQAMKARHAIYTRVMAPATTKGWTVKLEAWKDGNRQGGKSGNGYEVVLDGNKQYTKAPQQKFYTRISDAVPAGTTRTIELSAEASSREAEIVIDDCQAVYDLSSQTINEILAQEGVLFLGIKRSQNYEGRKSDIYRTRREGEENETIYYVDSKTDLPFLMEKVRSDGMVVSRTEIEFPKEIRLNVTVGVPANKPGYQVVEDGHAKTIEIETAPRVKG